MKKIVLTQRFKYYSIEPYRTFSKIGNKTQENLNIVLGNSDFFNENFSTVGSDENFSAFIGQKFQIKLHNKKECKKKNTKYFYSDEDTGEIVSLERWSNRRPKFYTTKERHLLKHFGRPFSAVSVTILERNITFDDTIISIRFNSYNKSRAVNCKFFKKTRTAYGFKLNLKTGNLITYEGRNPAKIRQNNFKHLEYISQLFFSITNNKIIYESNLKDKNQINIEAQKIFDDKEFIKCLTHLFLSNFPHNANIILSSEKNLIKKIGDLVMNAFVSINKIKVPNNFQKLLADAYPTKHFLKRNDNKLIASVLDRIGIKSKGTIRLLHQYPNLDVGKLIMLTRYFGHRHLHKYIHNINERFFTTASNSDIFSPTGSVYASIKSRYEYDIKDSEKRCLLKLINEFFSTMEIPYSEEMANRRGDNIVTMQFNTFHDHLDLLMRIKNYIPGTEIRATTLKDFHNEHLEFSKIDRAIKRGYSIKYVFEEKLIKHIETPIYVKDESGEVLGTFYPVLLKIDAEYTEEGAHMHHCVANYADRDRSIIISMREDGPQGHERVTCEYDTKDKGCLQEKYFCNVKPPERFDKALDILQCRILAYKGSIKSISKEKIPLIINGVQIEANEQDNLFGDILQII